MRLADPIVPQTQPTPVSCTATCVAMSLGIPVRDLGVPLDNSLNTEDFGIWYAERGIWMRPGIRINPWGERFTEGRLYLVGVRSLNTVGNDHAILVDTRGVSAFDCKVFDPNAGREGVQLYEWMTELSVVDFHELVQRGTSGYISPGEPV